MASAWRLIATTYDQDVLTKLETGLRENEEPKMISHHTEEQLEQQIASTKIYQLLSRLGQNKALLK